MATVRKAVPEDAEAIAEVHVASWETTYGGVLPDRYISERTRGARLAFWRNQLSDGAAGVCVFVACKDDGAVCGFASGGPERTEELGADGELYSLYLLEEAQGLGMGRALVAAVLGEMAGARRIAVWVLGVNPACGFYEKLGGRKWAEKRAAMGGEVFVEVAYDLGPGAGL
jgi:GNAT superfamily N-acetyltransferase